MKRAHVFVGVIAAAGAIFGATALYTSWSAVVDRPNAVRVQNATTSENAANTQALFTAKSNTPTANVELSPASDVSTMQPLNSAQINEVLEWKNAHGYVDFHRDYGELSEKDLLSLAQAGEIGALHILATRNGHKQPDKAIEYYQKAAVHGSTLALILIGELYMFHATDDGLIPEIKTKESGAQQALAYNFAAQILGDNAVGPVQSKRLIDDVLGEALLDESIIRQICRNAQSIIADIQETRTANGFVPFEQTTAPHSRPVDTSVSVYSYCGGNGH